MDKSINTSTSTAVKTSIPIAQKISLGILMVSVFIALFGLVVGLVNNFSIIKSSPQPTLEQLTNQLVDSARGYAALPAQKQSSKLSQLQSMARTRKARQLALIESNPKRVLESSLTSDTLAQLPEEILLELEQTVTLEGEYQIIAFDNFENKKFKQEYFLQGKDGQLNTLHFAADVPAIAPGSQIKLPGVKIDNEVIVADKADYQILSTPKENAISTHHIAVIKMNFLNDTTTPVGNQRIRDRLFLDTDSVRAFYNEVSYGQLQMAGLINPDGDIYGWYTVPYNNTSCNYNIAISWADAADAMAIADGLNLSSYEHIIYVFPKTSSCPWTGLAGISGNRVWMNGNFYWAYIYSHELGHNLGADEAAGYYCEEDGNPVPISNNCEVEVYEDNFDIMGFFGDHGMNTYHKAQFSWLVAENTATVTSSGSYTISPQEWSGSGIKNLVIPRKIYNGLVTENYYLEYRQPYGIFDDFNPSDPVVNGVSIRIASPARDKSKLIDTVASTAKIFWDAALLAGQTYTDSLAGIVVTTESVSPESARIRVDFTCIRATPYVYIGSSVYGRSGQSIVQPIKIINNDSIGCGPSTFSVVATLPSGWTQNPFSQVLAPNETIAPSITITPSLSAGEGPYMIPELVTNENDPGYSRTVNAYVTIDNTPPGVTISSPLNGQRFLQKSTVSIMAVSGDTKTTTLELLVDNTVVKTCNLNDPMAPKNCSYSWPAGTNIGTHIITAKNTDQAGNISQASAQITVYVPVKPPGPDIQITP